MPLAKRRSEQENVFTTNIQNQKINHLNQTALILTQGLTTATLQCTVKPLFFFFFTKSQPFNKKQPTGTINQIKRSEKTIPATTQSKTTKKTVKTNTTNYLINQSQNQSQKQSRQTIQNLSINNTLKTNTTSNNEKT